MVLSGFIYRNMTSERKQNPAKLVFSMLSFVESLTFLVSYLSMNYHYNIMY